MSDTLPIRNQGKSTIPIMENPQYYKDYLRSLYKIETLTTPSDIHAPGEVYSLFKRNWSDNVMSWVSACKTIILNKNDQSIGLIYFEPDGKINADHISTLFDVIKENIKDCASIIVAVNNPVNPFTAGSKEQNILACFDEFGKKANTRVSDRYMISPLGMRQIKRKRHSKLLARQIETRFKHSHDY
jgi:hypothetical protein